MPRRALGPIPGDDDDLPTGGRFSYLDDEDDGAPTVILRRLAMSPISPADPFEIESSTPVPPPAPVLPDPEAALAPAAGRRYSASAEPADYAWAAPRRSAASPYSPSSPESAIEPALPRAAKRPSAPPKLTVTVGARARSVADSARKHKPTLIIAAAVVAFVLVIATVVSVLTMRSNAGAGAPNGGASALDPLVTAADLGNLGGTAWSETTATNDAVLPLCLSDDADGLPTAQRTISRRLTAGGGSANTAVSVVANFADAAAATTAYSIWAAQAGTCPGVTALVTGANQVNGLADSAVAVRVTVQNESPEFHSLQVSRTGREVSLVDVMTTGAEVTATEVGTATMPSLSRLCTASEGTCPTNLVVASQPPPAGNLPGWLVEADLPRITAGAGRWGATEPVATLHLVGSQCEVIDINAVSGTTGVGQRTLLLADDPNAPSGFGVDQGVYSFDTEQAATALRDRLVKNIGACAKRAPTATIKAGPKVSGNGVGDVAIAGSTYLVTQKIGSGSVVFRVAVLTVGKRTVYLLANPTTGFDFTDTAWRQVAVRAGQRASQAG